MTDLTTRARPPLYHFEEVGWVYIELSTRCNSACPQCTRNLWGDRANPNLPLTELSLDDVRTILPPPVVQRLHYVHACGNYGDPALGRQTLEIMEYLRETNPALSIRMVSSGSVRSPSWWQRLARAGVIARFSIDGLEQTNAVYRRHTSWAKVMGAVEAFIGAGGEAEWDFIVFRHNEHQLDDAVAQARRLGFKKFYVKRTARFGDKATTQIFDRGGKVVGVIEPPRASEHRNPVTCSDAFIASRATRAARWRYLAETPIHCRARDQRSIYVSAEGLVFPCAYTAQIYPRSFPTLPRLRRLAKRALGAASHTISCWEIIAELPQGKRSLCALEHPLDEVVGGPLFCDLIPRGWERATSRRPRINTCPQQCGAHRSTAAEAGESLI